MDRARRSGTPATSRLTVKKKNRRRPGSVWSRLPKPAVALDACGRALRRSLPALVAATSVTAAGAGLYLGVRWVTHSPRFAITDIEIRGAQRLTNEEVRDLLPVADGANIFTTNIGNVERALAQHPWIATAEAHRELPHTLVIEVSEFAAVAVTTLESGETYLLDSTGKPFKRATTEEAAGLPRVTGLDRADFAADRTADTITTALATLALWRTGGERPAVSEVHVDATGTLSLICDEGAVIQLGHVSVNPAELAPRFSAFDAAWGELAYVERLRVRVLHLDGGQSPARPDHVTVAFKDQ
jgi:cell division protein FtsQ